MEQMRAMGHVHSEAERIAPGKTYTVEMTFPGPGTYEFVCGITGHAEAGMKGTLTVVK